MRVANTAVSQDVMTAIIFTVALQMQSAEAPQTAANPKKTTT